MRALRSAGLRGDELLDLAASAHARSGRVAQVRLDGLTPSSMTGEAFRLAVGRTLGWQVLKSSLFTITRTARGYRFDGRGRGHGVGLCVAGASQLAALGRTRADILATYFPGAAVVGLPGRVTTNRARVMLPSLDEADRGAIEGLVARALRDLETADRWRRAAWTSRSGSTRPSRATCVPADGAGGRAASRVVTGSNSRRSRRFGSTGCSSARCGTNLPTPSRGRRVAGRPTWVREGLADYFAEPARGAAPPAAACPDDESFAAARTPGALADLYDQARACVVRAIEAANGNWRTAAWEAGDR